MPKNTKEQIIDFALSFIQQKGFSSFSYDDIAKRLNITKAAIHYYYESKEDLGIAVCDKVKNIMYHDYEKNMERIQEHKGTPWEFIEDVLKTIAPNENCPILSLQADYENLSERFREEIKQVSKLQLDLFLNLVKAVSPSVDEMLMTQLFLSMKGALQYRRILGEEFFWNHKNMMKKQFELFLSQADKS